jgi:ribosomal protein L11 methyltransferase
MPWLELSLTHQRRDAERVERALQNVGALSVTQLDAGEQPILEPKPGETPLWREIHALALFPADADRRGLVEVLYELLPWLGTGQLAFRDVDDADWTRAWMDQFHPMCFGRRLWIYPSTVERRKIPTPWVVRLDPGLAFGTGTHATHGAVPGMGWTARSRRTQRARRRCGSGVLAIAALKLGARAAHGVDLDPQALSRAARTPKPTASGDRSVPRGRMDGVPGPYDFVVANIPRRRARRARTPDSARAWPRAGALGPVRHTREPDAEVVARYEQWCDELQAARATDGYGYRPPPACREPAPPSIGSPDAGPT